MKSITIFFAIVYSSLNLVSQNAKLQHNWAISIGGIHYDDILSISQDSAGNIYSTGYFHLNSNFDPTSRIIDRVSQGAEDIFVMKSSPIGRVLWVRNFGSKLDDRGSAIICDQKGGVYVSGAFKDSIRFNGTDSNGVLYRTDFGSFLLKLDEDGQFEWVRGMGYYGGHSTNLDLFSNGDVLVTCGNFYSKYISSGGRVFAKDFSAPNMGYVHRIFDAKIDHKDNIILVGDYYNRLTPDYRNVIQCLDYAGRVKWTKGYGDGFLANGGTGLAINLSGDVILTSGFIGTINFSGDSANPVIKTAQKLTTYILSLDSSGEFNRVYAFPTTSNSTSFGNKIAVHSNCDVYFNGSLSGDVVIDPKGKKIELKAKYYYDMFLMKLSPNFEFGWVGLLEGAGNNYSSDILIDEKKGEMLISGSLIGEIDMVMDKGGVSNFNLKSKGFTDGFISNYAIPHPTSINNYDLKKDIKLFPNPANNQLTISLENDSEIKKSYVISSTNGQLLLTGEFVSGEQESTLNIERLNAGVYTLQIQSETSNYVLSFIKAE